MMMLMPPPTFAICRITPTVPILLQILRPRVVLVVVLQQEQHQAVRRERPVHGLHRDGTVHSERLQRQRERHRAAKRQDGKFCGEGRSGFGHASGGDKFIE